MAGGRWPVASGQWPVAGGGSGEWPVARGRWPVVGAVAGGRRTVGGGQRGGCGLLPVFSFYELMRSMMWGMARR